MIPEFLFSGKEKNIRDKAVGVSQAGQHGVAVLGMHQSADHGHGYTGFVRHDQSHGDICLLRVALGRRRRIERVGYPDDYRHEPHVF